MTLEDLMISEEIINYRIWWYNANIAYYYIDDKGYLKDKVLTQDKFKDVLNCKDGQIVLIMSEINECKCRYRCSIRLKKTEKENTYKWERAQITLDKYANRMVFKREKGFSPVSSIKSSCSFVQEEIGAEESDRTVDAFTAYDKVDLTFEQLKELVDNNYLDYYYVLFATKAVYMIHNDSNGEMYIGSAYGKYGIWGRWKSYAKTYHGGNVALKELYERNGESHFKKFRYKILEILPIGMSDRDIVDCENFYKEIYKTREGPGLNRN